MKHNFITKEQQERIRYNAPRFYAKDLAELLGIKVNTLRTWARVHKVEFRRQKNQPLHIVQPRKVPIERVHHHAHLNPPDRSVEHLMELAEKASMKWIG